jgi:hypothetical protein
MGRSVVSVCDRAFELGTASLLFDNIEALGPVSMWARKLKGFTMAGQASECGIRLC